MDSLREVYEENAQQSTEPVAETESLLRRLSNSTDPDNLLQEFGFACTRTTELLVEVLRLLPPLDASVVGRIASMMARTCSGPTPEESFSFNAVSLSTLCAALDKDPTLLSEGGPTTWNADVVVEAIRQVAPDLDWVMAMRTLDQPSFLLPDQHSFLFLLEIFHKAAPQESFPIEAICGGIWRNEQGQLSFLRQAVVAPPEVFTWAHSPHRQLPLEGLHANKSPFGTMNQCWLSLDLIQTLVLLAEAGNFPVVRSILEHPVKHCPEVLLLGLAQCTAEWGVVQEEVFAALVPMFLANHPNSSLVLQRLWPLNRKAVLLAMLDLHTKDNSVVGRLLDVCQELKVLTLVLESTPFAFSIDLASLAARREYLNLEKWLQGNFNARGLPFVAACLMFLRQRATQPADLLQAQPKITLSVQTIIIFFKVMHAHMALLPPELQEEIKHVYSATVSVNPKLQGAAAEQAVPQVEGFSGDVEEETNAYFQRIYNSQQSIEEVVQMLQKFKSSAKVREQQIFACMVHNLFDEYRFFPKYPDKELCITGVLFGSLIQYGLVISITLGIALRYVLDALRKPLGTKWFTFGLEALNTFKSRLPEWPEYASYIVQIPHMRQALPDLVEQLERGLSPEMVGQVLMEGGGVLGGPLQTGIPQEGLMLPTSVANQPQQTSVLSGAHLFGPGMLLGSMPEIALTSEASVEQEAGLSAFRNAAPGSGAPGGGPPLEAAAQLAQLMQQSGGGARQPGGSPSFNAMQYHLPQPHRLHNQHHQSETTEAPTKRSTPSPQASPLKKTQSNKIEPSLSGSSLGFGTSLNLDTLMIAENEKNIPKPETAVADKVHFYVNNLSVQNLPQKINQIKACVQSQHVRWFAQYIVVKRASIEPNFHVLYVSLIAGMHQDPLLKETIQTTVRNVRVLLDSEKIKTNSGERSLLKNLGSWLGQLTIARNKPVLQKDLDPKTIIYNAFENGRMIAVIPFVAKLLEACKNSKVFKPPNPWLMAILSLIMEIYSEQDLKLNLKFEVEVLFKNLDLKISDVKPSCTLHNYMRHQEFASDWVGDKAVQQIVETNAKGGISTPSSPETATLTPSLSAPELQVGISSSQAGSTISGFSIGGARPVITGSEVSGIPDDVITSAALDLSIPTEESLVARSCTASPNIAAHPDAAPLFGATLEQALPNLARYITIGPNLAGVAERLHLKRLLPMALDNAVREIVSLVVERSVTIACMTTRELILKDFAMEPDDVRMRKAAHLMVSSLAGSLALVTCKEPLRLSIVGQLTTALQQLTGSVADTSLLEQTAHIATADNLDLGCALIEKAATDKAIRDIDEALAPAYAIRRKHREAGQAYVDMQLYQQGRYPSSLPEVLRPKPGHMQPAQQRVYEDFVDMPRTMLSPPPPPPIPYGPPPTTGATAGMAYPSGIAGMGNLVQPMHQLFGTSQEDAAAGDTLLNEVNESTLRLPALSSEDVLKEDLNGMRGTTTSGDPLGLMAAAVATQDSLTQGAVMEKYRAFSLRLDSLLSKEPPQTKFESLATDHVLRVAIGEVRDMLRSAQSIGEASLGVAQRLFQRLYEGPEGSVIHVTTHLATLEQIRDVNQRLVKELTTWVIYSDEDRKLNQEIAEGLVQSRLLNVTEFDSHVAKLMNNGRNKAATEFASHLVRQCIVNEPHATAADFFNILDVLGKVSQQAGAAENLAPLIEQARSGTVGAISRSTTPSQSGAQDLDAAQRPRGPGSACDPRSDPPMLREQVAAMFEEWARVCESLVGDDGQMKFAQQLQLAGMLKCDETTDRVLRILTELSVAHCLSSEAGQISGATQPILNFAAIDAYARLVLLLVKFLRADTAAPSSPSSATGPYLTLFCEALDMAAEVLFRDSEERGSALNARPYFRLFSAWVMSLGAPDPILDANNIQTLVPITNALLQVQPLRVPGFSFAYLELISHRMFLPRLLLASGQKGWPHFQKLLSNMLKFMEPYLRNAKLTEPVRLLYKGTLRVLLVLLHDFPEFLCDHHFNLCDHIPPSCIQMRNLILSAFPRSMRLPDPFTPNLKVDLLPEISQTPRILSEAEHVLRNRHMHQEVNNYLKTRQPANFCSDLRHRLMLSPLETVSAGTRFNVPLLNALVLYVGIQAISQMQSKTQQAQSPISQSAPMEVFQRLVTELDTEGRYLLLNAVANQLRYPNNHTHYFSCVLLFMFSEAQQEIVQEQITRVLLERLIVNRPHPWGLLITFIELIKNPRYKFWSHGFTRCAPEIERLFESVAHSCMGPPAPRPSEEELGGVISGVNSIQVSE